VVCKGAATAAVILLLAGAGAACSGEPVILESGLLDYRLPTVLEVKGGRFSCLASELPRDQRRAYHCGGARELRAVYEDEPLAEETHWYYWRVAQEGKSAQYPGNATCARGHLAWSSPHWVIVK